MNLFDFFKKKTSLKTEYIPNWYSHALERNVILDIYLPPGYKKQPNTFYPLLLVNDGQDLPRMNYKKIVGEMFDKNEIPPFITVGIHANSDRIREYGTARQPDYKGRGDWAIWHKTFVLEELLPFLRSSYHASSDPSEVYFAGFSLGALSALDIAWSAPDVFGGAGVFSGALWWRWSDVRPEDPDADRIMHDIIRTDNSSTRPNNQFFWFQTGTKDEDEDRNNNGVIDAIDDTLACIEALQSRGYYREQIRYLEIENGTHDPETWGKAMPDFLDWIFNNIGGGMEQTGY